MEATQPECNFFRLLLRFPPHTDVQSRIKDPQKGIRDSVMSLGNYAACVSLLFQSLPEMELTVIISRPRGY